MGFCRGCGATFSLSKGLSHIEGVDKNSMCWKYKTFCIYEIRIGPMTYKMLGHPEVDLFAKMGLPVYRCEGNYFYTTIGEGRWRRQAAAKWGYDWAIELATLSTLNRDKGEAAKAINKSRKDIQFRKALQAVLALAIQPGSDNELGAGSQASLPRDWWLEAKHAAMKQFLEGYE